ncbi:MAG: hypothetical protein E6G01_09895 [Actinobacteria bacterium]|nr:MAG: hypothetical protein E6G01_09895 [Actinomycetota bacterium]
MSWWVARPHDNELFEAPRQAARLGPLLGASAVSLVLLGILALLAADDVEPFGGSVSVLAGLLCGAGLVVAGLAGVARRQTPRPRDTAGVREDAEAASSARGLPPGARADRRRPDDTRIMRTLASGPPPPPVPATRRVRRAGSSSRYTNQSPGVSRPSSSRTSA